MPAVRLAEDVGLRRIAGKLEEFGFEEEFERVPSLPLGVTEVTLRELVAAYSAFPSLGNVPELHLIREVRNERGRTIYRREPRQERAIEAPVAWLTHDLLRGVVLRGTASRLADEGLDYVAGKTGTTTDCRDAWFVGYALDLVTGLWIGCDGGSPLRLSAAEAALPLWAAYMGSVKTSRAEIPPPEGIVFREIDPTNGRRWRPGCAGPVREAFLEGTEPETDCRGGGRTLLARVRGNPEPPEMSAETWRRRSAEPIVRGRTAPRRAGADRDERPRFAAAEGSPTPAKNAGAATAACSPRRARARRRARIGSRARARREACGGVAEAGREALRAPAERAGNVARAREEGRGKTARATRQGWRETGRRRRRSATRTRRKAGTASSIRCDTLPRTDDAVRAVAMANQRLTAARRLDQGRAINQRRLPP